MNLPMLATDNITELLLKIIEFTQMRQKILIRNIISMNRRNFVPRDLPVEEFSNLMKIAVNEYNNSRRLVLCDGQRVKFGAGGSFAAAPIIDQKSKQLFKKNRKEFLRVQITRLFENSLNQKIAMELLKKKQAYEGCSGRCLN